LNIIKNESGKVCFIEHVHLLFQCGNVHVYSDQAAEAFNKYFFLFGRLNIEHASNGSATLYLRN